MKRGAAGVYLGGFLQGAAFVLIPALGPTLRHAPYTLGNATYGLLYFPEIIGAILAALAAGWVHRRLGGAGLFRLGALCNAAAMALLVAAYFARGHATITLLLGETLLLGIGFGLTNAAINRAASLLYATAPTAAVTMLNAVIGGATAVSPLALEVFQSVSAWALWPALLLVLWLMLIFLPTVAESTAELGGLSAWRRSMAPFALAVLIYAICEGSFGSWANIVVSVNRGLPTASGALALALFWGGMTTTRFFLGAIPESLLPRTLVYRLAPLGIAACFLVIPDLQSAPLLIGAFAAAGVACGIYYPYTMAYGIAAHPEEGTQLAGLLVGSLMVGEGIGSFGLGPLQHLLSLADIYRVSALWAVPLIMLAWRNSFALTSGEPR